MAFNYPLSVCADCARLTAHMNPSKVTCQAYPNGIPTDILNGLDKDLNQVTHTAKRKDQDNDLVFVGIDDLSLEELEKLKRMKIK